ncbi:unnamed protein product [Callosobruchus maculatus]|uniref:Uncharacterized protein n=1 Tax=Callosobruchus maculatus TaxID=64391 RepID=A0A653C3D7_CALMS|nr:unnamed protein product [Callosobruchus maculatus]
MLVVLGANQIGVDKMLTKLAVLCFLFNLSVVYGFGQDIIGLPAEHDLNRYNGFLSNWVRLYANNEAENVVDDETIENMLETYHRVRKRSANADDAIANEGTNSTAVPPGNATHVVQTPVAPNNESLANSTANTSEPTKVVDISPPTNLNATEGAGKNVTSIGESTESTPIATKSTNVDGTGNATINSTVTSITQDETTTSNVTIEAINSTATINTISTDAGKEVESEIKQTDKNVTKHTEVLGETPVQINSTTSSTPNHPETHLKTFANDDKMARKATDKENIDHHQSGNAVMTNGDKTMSETDASLGKAAAHASIGTGSQAASPKEGASSSSTASASTGNDTKIIIFLGVAVAVVGVAAVGYNYSRKKRRTNRGSARAGQNGDVETGREMKPLMRSNVEAAINKEAEINAEESK